MFIFFLVTVATECAYTPTGKELLGGDCLTVERVRAVVNQLVRHHPTNQRRHRHLPPDLLTKHANNRRAPHNTVSEETGVGSNGELSDFRCLGK